jgi:broad specificity phosphatase PhoE
MAIFLVRHGETDWNREMRMQGREDIPLNDSGIWQAKNCGKAFDKIKIDKIISSPLSRAKLTAEIIGEHQEIKDILIDPDLIERDFGIYSGNTYVQGDSYRNSNGTDGMETLEDLFERMEQVVKKYINQGNVILVSHGASINAALSVFSKGEIGLGKTWLKNSSFISRFSTNPILVMVIRKRSKAAPA